MLRWTGEPRDAVRLGVDGCTAVCFALSVRAMATAYARFGTSAEAAARRLREAMVAHPELVAGTGRPCTDVMSAARGTVVAKVGAEGIYCAALPGLGLGVALKVEDGDMLCSPPALLSVLRQVGERRGLGLGGVADLRQHSEPVLRTTRGEPVGALRATGALRFH